MTGRSTARESYLHSLDLLRGFAALSVCLYHTGFLFISRIHLLPGGYLCVDIFFLLSGFVIARTYDPRIAAGMTVGAFCVQRLARLYPLFLATTVIGFAVVMAGFYIEKHVPADEGALLTLFGNLLLIPNFLHPYGTDTLFPYNSVTWSIFFEFYVNVLFFLFWPLLTMRRLAAIVSVSVVFLAASAVHAHSLDIGDKTADLVSAIPRVSYSFFLGVLISRWESGERRHDSVRPLYLGLGAVLAIISLRGLIPASLVWLSDLCTVVFVFPVAILAFVRVRLFGYRARVSGFAGNISYSVYLLQTPFAIAYSGLPQILFREKIASLVPWAGAIFLPAVVVSAYLVWRYFEVPAKHAVRQRYAAVSAALRRPA